MDINLLPWRLALKVRQIKHLVWYGTLLCLFMFILIAVREYYARHHLAEEEERHQKLEQQMAIKMAAYRKQLYAKRHQRQVVNDSNDSEEGIVQDAPLQAEVIQVNYAKATELAALLKDSATGLLSEAGILTADARTNVIWIQDTQERVIKFKKVLKSFDVPSRQVLIEARLVNMSQECAEDLGIRFGLLGDTQAPTDTTTPATPQSSGNRRLNVDLGAVPLDATAATIGLAVATLSQNKLLDMELSALESEGRAEIIASPKLMTTNQEPAVIESGEDIPYQEVTPSGATSVSFKKAVLSLRVLPQITAEGKLMMALSINQNSDSGRRVQGVPIILTKAIETHVLVHHGQTIVLGGIYKQDQQHSVARVPFLGTLPVVGNFFRRKQMRTHHDELLIFITPKIVGYAMNTSTAK